MGILGALLAYGLYAYIKSKFKKNSDGGEQWKKK
jgi:hypothetical protein